MTEDSAIWRRRAAAVAAILLGLIFLVSGGWKVLRPFQTGELLEQAQVPAGLGVGGAVALGTLELFSAFLLLMPRFRRWGGLVASGLLIFFIGWIGFYYPKLVGHECSCFPIIKRTVGPDFFIGDAIMLLLGLIAFAWSSKVRNLRIPAMALLALAALAAVSFGVNAAERHNVQVPNPVVVEGKPQDLTQGNVFLFFYDPQCSHCFAAAKFLSGLNWDGTRVIGIPTAQPQFAKEFLQDTHFKAEVSPELDRLRKAFPFVDPPFGVALVDGQVKQTFPQAEFNEPSPAAALQKLGLTK